MWRSLGDKYDLSRHDESKNPRKFKANTLIVITLIIVFLGNTWSFSRLLPAEGLTAYITLVINILGLLVFALSAFLKWKKNNKELDVILVVGIFILLLLTFVSCHDVCVSQCLQ